MVSDRCVGIRMRSYFPGLIGGALRCSTTSSRIRSAFSLRFICGTTSKPAETGEGSNDRLFDLGLATSTAFADNEPTLEITGCWIDEPSLEAKYLSSDRHDRLPFAPKTSCFFLI